MIEDPHWLYSYRNICKKINNIIGNNRPAGSSPMKDRNENVLIYISDNLKRWEEM